MNSREYGTARRADDDPFVDGGTGSQGNGPKDGSQGDDTHKATTEDEEEHLDIDGTSINSFGAASKQPITNHTVDGPKPHSQSHATSSDDDAANHGSNCEEAKIDADSAGRSVSATPIDPERIYKLVLAELRMQSCFWTLCVRCYKGASLDDALHDVMEEFLNALTNNMTLANGDKLPATEQGIIRHLVVRVFNRLTAPRNGEKRQRNLREEHKDTIIDMQLLVDGVAVEHPFFDREFRIELINRARKDPLVHTLIHVLMYCQYLPKTPDISSGEHSRLAEYLGMTPSELRNAARRLKTLKNKMIEERNRRAEG